MVREDAWDRGADGRSGMRRCGVLRRPLDKLKDVDSRLALWGEGHGHAGDDRAVRRSAHLRGLAADALSRVETGDRANARRSARCNPVKSARCSRRFRTRSWWIAKSSWRSVFPTRASPWTAWMLLFWKAAAAGWRSYSIGGEGRAEGTARPSRPGGGVLSQGRSPIGCRRLGPREPELGARRRCVSPARPGTAPTATSRASCSSRRSSRTRCRTAARSGSGISAARSPRASISSSPPFARSTTTPITPSSHEVFREVRIVDIDQRASTDERLPAQVRGHQSAVMRAADRRPRARVAARHPPDRVHPHGAFPRCRARGPRDPGGARPDVQPLPPTRRDANRRAEATAEYQRWLEFERGWLRATTAFGRSPKTTAGSPCASPADPAETTFNVAERRRYRTLPPARAAAARRRFSTWIVPAPAEHDRLREVGARGDAASLEGISGGAAARRRRPAV